MPKKRTYNFKQLHGSSSPSDKNGDKRSPTVKERLGELRKLEGTDAIRKKQELSESANQPSVPPHLQGILGLPDTAPPRPRHGNRQRLAGRPPGPAVPESWLQNRSNPANLVLRVKQNQDNRGVPPAKERNRPSELLRFHRLSEASLDVLDTVPPSLLHLSLKCTAQNWDLFEEEDLPALAEMPQRLRSVLLSYLGFYGPSIDVSALAALTQGGDPVTMLDLSGLAGHGALSMARLVKWLKIDASRNTDEWHSDEVVESWDEDVVPTPLTTGTFPGRFDTLTHLSLSNPPPGILWKDLLMFSNHTPCVTHLSLAYWPRPTLTPNMATTTIYDRNGQAARAGGSHYYSNLDGDFAEPVTLLRQLSANLLCLQWLDLEGCTAWIPALAYSTDTQREPRSRTNEDDQPSTLVANNFMFTNWKNLTSIRVFQGWRPEISGLKASSSPSDAPNAAAVVAQFMNTVPIQLSREPEMGDTDEYDAKKRKAGIWVDNEVQLITTGALINMARQRRACKLIQFDHGWVRRIFAPKVG